MAYEATGLIIGENGKRFLECLESSGTHFRVYHGPKGTTILENNRKEPIITFLKKYMFSDLPEDEATKLASNLVKLQ